MAPLYQPDYGNFPGVSRPNWVRNVLWSILALCVAAVAIRIGSKVSRREKLWQEDATIILSLVSNRFLSVLGFKMSYQQGLGLDITELEVGQLASLNNYLFVTRILHAWTCCFTKLSILLLHYRIFGFMQEYRLAIWIIGLFVVNWAVVMTFVFAFTCVPVTGTWQSYWALDTNAHCSSTLLMDWPGNIISSLCTDLAIIVLHLSQLQRIWKLQMKTSNKVVLTAIFTLDFVVIGVSAYRLYTIFSYTHTDPTFTAAAIWVWSQIESATRIVSACLTMSGHFLRGCVPQKAAIRYIATSCFAQNKPMSSSYKSLIPARSRQLGDASSIKTVSRMGPGSPTYEFEARRTWPCDPARPRPWNPVSLSVISDDESADFDWVTRTSENVGSEEIIQLPRPTTSSDRAARQDHR
ncbi:hypothetical protein BD289DRAFT_373173 [Coniella lustricola]|uniref:Rhodopsin domain-containing protein n=1 Tax=Coniella lustricola TaxID=2025994 RepID=A0A2T3A194_9PEZI|nr:hypothetical protein BD289DRAFT_373173 [Coniella lustricola]